ncbi:MAG TPA: sortase [Chloroflexia bacterium]|nr:sortase [Chloroflexia bacterium]
MLRSFFLGVAAIAVILPPALGAPAAAAAPPAIPAADPAFDRVWARTDQLVSAQNVTRSWFWGGYPFARLDEPFAGTATGTRTVEYYDKSRMEINDPQGDRNSPWFVTNGLLVKELISGVVATGPEQTTIQAPSTQPVVGDWTPQNHAPSYAALGNVASLAGSGNRAPNRVGSHVAETLDAAGQVGTSPLLASAPGTRLGTYVAASGHNIPDIFWSYMNAQGPYLDGRDLRTGPLVNWVYTMGYPITEPYWVRARVGTSDRDVLIQAFERRILSYTPANAPAWQVEMGNAGRHYYDWRYGATRPGQLAPPAVAVRIVAPTAHIDTRIIPTYIDHGAWQVADYAAGWLYGTPQPGQPGNSVFAGHNNWHGEVFRYLEFMQIGDAFTIYTSDNVAHHYQVTEMYKVPEQGVDRAQQVANARYVNNTPDERVTLITCWPYTTYTHRLIVIGHPVP